MRVYIGHDPREERSFRVAAATAASFGNQVIPLREDWLRMTGLITRPVYAREGSTWDLNSDAPQSTRFATARFWVPILAHSGWCLFADGDVVFLRDPAELMDLIDKRYAVMVVKHQMEGSGLKMDGQPQTNYRRKNWSSVALWNVNHPSNRRLNTVTLNNWPGRDLHAFAWLSDDEIGELPAEWNWLVGMQPKPGRPAIAHFTLGTPELVPNAEYAEIWHQAAKDHDI